MHIKTLPILEGKRVIFSRLPPCLSSRLLNFKLCVCMDSLMAHLHKCRHGIKGERVVYASRQTIVPL